MALYKSAWTVRFHSSLELKPVADSGPLFLPALSCRRHIYPSQWDQPKGFGPSTESPTDARLFSLLRHAFHETLTSRGADWKHKRIWPQTEGPPLRGPFAACIERVRNPFQSFARWNWRPEAELTANPVITPWSQQLMAAQLINGPVAGFTHKRCLQFTHFRVRRITSVGSIPAWCRHLPLLSSHAPAAEYAN